MKKSIFFGILVGALAMVSFPVGAMTNTLEGRLYTQNPLVSAPKGYAYTMGHKKITAKCTATKNGESNSKSASANKGETGGSVETEWVYGPEYTAAGTVFDSVHTGYTSKGIYQTKTATYKY